MSSETIEQLLQKILSVTMEWDWDGKPSGPDLDAMFGQRVHELGVPAVLRAVFRVAPGSMGVSLMLKLSFVWKDFTYDQWIEVLEQPPELRDSEISRFELFFTGYLALSFRQSVMDSNLPGDLLGESMDIPENGPLWGHVEDVFQNRGLSVWDVWRTLAATGGSMLVADDRLSSGK